MKRFKLTDLFVLDESQFVGDENLEYGKSYVKTFIKELNAIFGEKDNPAGVAFADSWFKINDNSVYNSKLQMYVYVKENVSRDTVEETLQELCDEYECDYQITWFQERKIEDGWKFVDFDLLLTTDKWSKNSDDSHVDISSLYLDSKKVKDNDKDLAESLVANGSVATKKEAKERVKRLNKEEKEKLGQSIKQQNKSNFYNDDKPNFEVYVDKDEWLQDPVNDEEAEALNAIVKSGWYNEEQFNSMIEKIKDYADKKFEETNSNKWYEAWYSITYYMDFDQYFNEISDDESKVRIIDLTKDNKVDRIYVGTFIVDGDKVRCIVEAFDITDALESIKDYFNAKKVEATMLYSYYDKFEWLKEHPDKAKDIIRSSNKFADADNTFIELQKLCKEYHDNHNKMDYNNLHEDSQKSKVNALKNEIKNKLGLNLKLVDFEDVYGGSDEEGSWWWPTYLLSDGTYNVEVSFSGGYNQYISIDCSKKDAANVTDASKNKYDDLKADVQYHYITDISNGEDMSKFLSRVLLTYLPNEYSRQLTADEKQVVREYVKELEKSIDKNKIVDDSKKEKDYSYAVVYKNDNGSYAAETYGSYKHCLDYINKPNNEAKNTYGEDNKEFRYFIVPNNGKYVPVGPVKEEKKEEVKDSSVYIPGWLVLTYSYEDEKYVDYYAVDTEEEAERLANEWNEANENEADETGQEPAYDYEVVENNGRHFKLIKYRKADEDEEIQVTTKTTFIDAVDDLDIEEAAKEYIQKFREENDLVEINKLINVEKVDDNTYICTFDFDAEDYTDFKDVDGDSDGFVNDLSDIGVDAIDARVENEIISDFELTNFKAELSDIKLDVADDDITNTSVSYEEESIGGYEYMGHHEFDKSSYEVLVSGVLEQFAAGKLIVEFTKK